VRLRLDAAIGAAAVVAKDAVVTAIAEKPRGPSELRPHGVNGWVTQKRGFTARTAPDGSVAFDDRHGGLAPPRSAEEIEAQGAPQQAWVDEPGSVTGGRGVLAPQGQVEFDATDELMRAAGMDPYLAEKLAFMDRTRDERMQIAARWRSDSLREALHRMPRELERLWRAGGDPTARRRLLFQLWDECAESGSPEVLATARAVRGTVLAFIRRRLPRGSRHGYGDEELAALNRARTSRERFAPYEAVAGPSARK
jgi:hypothetical protein